MPAPSSPPPPSSRRIATVAGRSPDFWGLLLRRVPAAPMPGEVLPSRTREVRAKLSDRIPTFCPAPLSDEATRAISADRASLARPSTEPLCVAPPYSGEIISTASSSATSYRSAASSITPMMRWCVSETYRIDTPIWRRSSSTSASIRFMSISIWSPSPTELTIAILEAARVKDTLPCRTWLSKSSKLALIFSACGTFTLASASTFGSPAEAGIGVRAAMNRTAAPAINLNLTRSAHAACPACCTLARMAVTS